MKLHCIKIIEDFANSIIDEVKSFEIRYNDRDYQVGDHIIFNAVDTSGEQVRHLINEKRYAIIYVIAGWGLKENYVAFGIKEADHE